MNLEIIHVGLLGTNCYITWDEEKNCVVVDCGGDAQKVAQFIQEKGLTPTHLLLTHGHGDHMGGAADLKDLYPQMKIVLDSKDLEMIGDGQKSMSDAVAPYARSFTPDVLVGDGDQLTCGTMEFTVLETPGHTPGSVTYLKNNELYEQMTASLARLGSLQGYYKVFPGHGSATNLEDEKLANPFLKQAIARRS